MDVNDWRGVYTLILMASFIGLIIWAYSKRRKKDFDEAANLPFADDETNEKTIKHGDSKP